MSSPEPTGQNNNDAPQWARDQITSANNEAAQRRIELRNKETELAAALAQVQTLQDEKASAVAEAIGTKNELLKLNIALGMGLPGERALSVAGRIKGATEDELKADAAALVADFGLNQPVPQPRATDPSQGRGGDSAPTPNTPQAEFASMLSGLGMFRNQ